MKRPIVCVMSEIPNITEVIRQRCAAVVSKLTSVDPRNMSSKDELTLNEAEVIISEPHHSSHWLYGRPNLALVHGTWAGIDSMVRDIPADGPLPAFKYCRFSGVFGQQIAEYVLSYIVAQERNYRLAYQEQAASHWSTEIPNYIQSNSRPLNTLSIGVLGLGDIGKKVASGCKAFGMRVWAIVNSIPCEADRCAHVDEYRLSNGLDEVLSSCDYICNILPSTPLTRALLDNGRLEACGPKKSVFINVGRGDICTETSILQALEQKWIRAAILDVFPTEPLPKTSPLWTHPNVTITPHIAGVSMPHQVADAVIENLHNYVSDRPLNYLIDWKKGY